MGLDRIGSKKFHSIWNDLEEGKKVTKKIAWDNDVSEGTVRNIKRDNPLFFGWLNSYDKE